jgi:hypothetical protein
MYRRFVSSQSQWARISTPQDILCAGNQHAALRAWRARMIGLYDNLADRFGHYPDHRRGPDGRQAVDQANGKPVM